MTSQIPKTANMLRQEWIAEKKAAINPVFSQSTFKKDLKRIKKSLHAVQFQFGRNRAQDTRPVMPSRQRLYKRLHRLLQTHDKVPAWLAESIRLLFPDGMFSPRMTHNLREAGWNPEKVTDPRLSTAERRLEGQGLDPVLPGSDVPHRESSPESAGDGGGDVDLLHSDSSHELPSMDARVKKPAAPIKGPFRETGIKTERDTESLDAIPAIPSAVCPAEKTPAKKKAKMEDATGDCDSDVDLTSENRRYQRARPDKRMGDYEPIREPEMNPREFELPSEHQRNLQALILQPKAQKSMLSYLSKTPLANVNDTLEGDIVDAARPPKSSTKEEVKRDIDIKRLETIKDINLRMSSPFFLMGIPSLPAQRAKPTVHLATSANAFAAASRPAPSDGPKNGLKSETPITQPSSEEAALDHTRWPVDEFMGQIRQKSMFRKSGNSKEKPIDLTSEPQRDTYSKSGPGPRPAHHRESVAALPTSGLGVCETTTTTSIVQKQPIVKTGKVQRTTSIAYPAPAGSKPIV